MLSIDSHKRALDRLDALIDPDHVAKCEQAQNDLQTGKALAYLPCTIGVDIPEDWPTYSFTECWDDPEKNLVSGLGYSYCGALLRDDRLYHARPEYGVVNIPEVFGVPSQVTNEGRSMSEGINDARAMEELVARGVPNFDCAHTRKIDAWYEFARETLASYENLSRFVHLVLPDTQGPFDLACLIYGSDIFTAIYDYPELVRKVLALMTDVYITYNQRYKAIIGESSNSAYHISGLKLARGGIRICDDSATLTSPAIYREFVKPYNLQCFAPFDGGWLHYCGDGNHILDEILDMACVNYLHLGNPDSHDLLNLIQKTSEKNIVLFWSGSLDHIQEALEIAGHSRLFVLTENRYASKSLEKAKENLVRVRAGRPIEKAAY